MHTQRTAACGAKQTNSGVLECRKLSAVQGCATTCRRPESQRSSCVRAYVRACAVSVVLRLRTQAAASECRVRKSLGWRADGNIDHRSPCVGCHGCGRACDVFMSRAARIGPGAVSTPQCMPHVACLACCVMLCKYRLLASGVHGPMRCSSLYMMSMLGSSMFVPEVR